MDFESDPLEQYSVRSESRQLNVGSNPQLYVPIMPDWVAVTLGALNFLFPGAGKKLHPTNGTTSFAHNFWHDVQRITRPSGTVVVGILLLVSEQVLPRPGFSRVWPELSPNTHTHAHAYTQIHTHTCIHTHTHTHHHHHHHHQSHPLPPPTQLECMLILEEIFSVGVSCYWSCPIFHHHFPIFGMGMECLLGRSFYGEHQ